eukprot:TRINITY_DN50265_c0_g1_i1.p1 TRINITY_DN50265_c0_g1~~TRINITY_DN50265_c0_g1_i1.p1  ORF type:complete len:113 (-),score=24.22 TRINITY_DN50265_c0_g1_i1:169-507(-)
MASPQRRDRKKQGHHGAATDQTSSAEERLVQVFDQVVQGVLKEPPKSKDGVPASILQSLCLLHPRFKDFAELNELRAEEQRLKDEVNWLKTKGSMPDPRRKKKNESTTDGGD